MNIKKLSEFDYEKNKEKKGFFFLANSHSSENSIKGLCDKLILSHVAEAYPKEVYQQANLTIFVYGDIPIDMPAFFKGAKMAEQVGICKVGSLAELKEVLTSPE